MTTTGAAPKVMFVTGHPDHRLVDRRVVAGARTRGVCCGFVAMLMRCDCCRWLLETTLLRETTPRLPPLRSLDLFHLSFPLIVASVFRVFTCARGLLCAQKTHSRAKTGSLAGRQPPWKDLPNRDQGARIARLEDDRKAGVASSERVSNCNRIATRRRLADTTPTSKRVSPCRV